MLNKISRRFLNINKICSLEIQMTGEQDLLFRWLLMCKDKTVLHVESNGAIKGSVKDFMSNVNPEIPLVITFSGKGILHKKIQQANFQQGNALSYVFPNAKAEDYIQQVYGIEPHTYYVSVVRKEVVENILQEFFNEQYFVLASSIQPFVLNEVVQLTQTILPTTNFGSHTLFIQNNLVQDYKFNIQEISEDISIAGQAVSSIHALSFAQGFMFFINDIARLSFLFEPVNHSHQEYIQKKKYAFYMYSALGFFLFILLLNMILYTTFSSTNGVLKQQSEYIQKQSINNDSTVEDFNEKEKFLMNAGWLNPSILSFYADRIAASVPTEIALTELNLNPFNESLSNQESKEVFNAEQIIVKGYTQKLSYLNKWTKKLDLFKWVVQVKVQDYNFDHKENKASFTLLITTTGEME